MIIPQFWAEAKEQVITDGRPLMLRRFGWSDVSMAEANDHAKFRLAEAITAWKSGDRSLSRRERQLAYGGDLGLPIREEVLERGEYGVITRNVYGARCLNTPNVMIVDIDYREKSIIGCLLSAASLFALIVTLGRQEYYYAAIAFGVFVVVLGLTMLFQRYQSHSIVSQAIQRVRREVRKRDGWCVRVYDTPAGLRLIGVHDLFEPKSSLVKEFLEAVRSDPSYVKLCQKQNCFRARVSAKPWRCDIQGKIPPGVWPVPEERLELRKAWVQKYELQCQSFAACRFKESLGSAAMHPIAAHFVQWHDRLCSANSNLPLA
jgi:hypothetical protein